MIAKTNNLKKYKKVIIIVSCILAFIIVCLSTFLIVIKVGEKRLRDSLSFTDDTLNVGNAYGDEADAYYNGEAYYYNKELINILVIGVDKNDKSDNTDHQADALYLLSVDTDNKKVNVLSISRNTLADIDIYDMNSEFLATEKSQICLSYAYGKDDQHSSKLTCKAVSKLLYNLPINSYYTIFMDSIGDIVNAVGGVEVVLQEDMSHYKTNWTVGNKVVLYGKDALVYLQHRKNDNQTRVVRQQQFIKSFITKAKSVVLKDLSLPSKLYEKFAKKSVTNVKPTSAVYLATKVLDAQFNINSLPGKVGFDGKYETFEIDENLLYEQILNIFYKK